MGEIFVVVICCILVFLCFAGDFTGASSGRSSRKN